MKREAHRVSRLVSQKVWAIRESTLDVMVEILRMRAAGIELSQEEVQARIGAGPQRPVGTRSGAVGVLNLHGVIAPRMNMMTQISGGVSLDVWLQGFRTFRDDPDVSSIVIDGDTPGGDVRGLIEAADEIYRAREIKPVVGVVRHMVASAGLWLFSACSEIVCTPSGEIGSLGCYMVHEDWSKANEMMGVKPTYIAYGKYKTEGNFDNPIDEEALAYAQAQVDKIGVRFEKTVSKYRAVPLAKVRSDFGQGRLLMAEDARAVGMVDRVATFEDTIARLTGTKRRAAAASTGNAAVVASDDVTEDENESLTESGTITDVQVYDRALTDTEVAAAADDSKAEDVTPCETCGRSATCACPGGCKPGCETCDDGCPCKSTEDEKAAAAAFDRDQLEIARAR